MSCVPPIQIASFDSRRCLGLVPAGVSRPQEFLFAVEDMQQSLGLAGIFVTVLHEAAIES
jgi:hypothetical protein